MGNRVRASRDCCVWGRGGATKWLYSKLIVPRQANAPGVRISDEHVYSDASSIQVEAAFWVTDEYRWFWKHILVERTLISRDEKKKGERRLSLKGPINDVVVGMIEWKKNSNFDEMSITIVRNNPHWMSICNYNSSKRPCDISSALQRCASVYINYPWLAHCPTNDLSSSNRSYLLWPLFFWLESSRSLFVLFCSPSPRHFREASALRMTY